MRKSVLPALPADPDVLLDAKQVARIINMSPKFVEGRRVRGGGIPYIKVGRYVRYRRNDVEAWLDSRTHTSTSQRLPRGAA